MRVRQQRMWGLAGPTCWHTHDVPLSATRSVPRLLLLVLGSLLFVAAGWWLVSSGGIQNLIAGWASMVFFGACGIVALVQVVRPKPVLTIDAYGVTWTAHSDQTIPWAAISDLGILKPSRGAGFLVLVLEDPSRFPPRRPSRRSGPSLSKKWYGGDVFVSLGTLNTSAKAVMAAVDQYWPPR